MEGFAASTGFGYKKPIIKDSAWSFVLLFIILDLWLLKLVLTCFKDLKPPKTVSESATPFPIPSRNDINLGIIQVSLFERIQAQDSK